MTTFKAEIRYTEATTAIRAPKVWIEIREVTADSPKVAARIARDEAITEANKATVAHVSAYVRSDKPRSRITYKSEGVVR